jgi:hypothetical protein
MKEPGLDDRHRDADGQIQDKRDDALVGLLRKTYGEDFRSDATLGTLDKAGAASLTGLVKHHNSSKKYT